MTDDPTAPHDPIPGGGVDPTQAVPTPAPEPVDPTQAMPTPVGPDTTAEQPIVPPPVDPPVEGTTFDEPPPGGGNNGWKIAIIVLLALIAVVLLLILLLGGSDDDGSGDSTTTTSTSTTSTSTTTSSTTTTTEPTTTTTAPTTTTTAPATGPAITSLTASAIACPDQLTLTWASARATEVEIAIDSPGGVYEDGLPPNGSLAVPAPCDGDTQTYYVTAIDGIGDRSTKTLTLP